MRAFLVACLIAVCLLFVAPAESPDRSTDAQTETVLAGVECPCSLIDCLDARVASDYIELADTEVESAVLKLPRESAESEGKFDTPHPIDKHGKTVDAPSKLPHYGMCSFNDTVEATDAKGHFSVGVRL